MPRRAIGFRVGVADSTVPVPASTAADGFGFFLQPTSETIANSHAQTRMRLSYLGSNREVPRTNPGLPSGVRRGAHETAAFVDHRGRRRGHGGGEHPAA